MSGRKFIEVLEKSGLLDAEVVADVKRQFAENKGKVSAEAMAKTLVDRGHLTKFQATKFVSESTSDEEAAARKSKAADDDLLDLAPLDDDDQPIVPSKPAPVPGKPAPAKPAAGKPAKPASPKGGSAPPPPAKGAPRGKTNDPESEEDVVLLEDAAGAPPVDVSGLTPVMDAGVGLTPIGHDTSGLTPVTPGLSPMELGGPGYGPPGGNGLGNVGSLDPFTAAASGAPTGSKPFIPKKKETRWDTKLMLGGGGVLLVLLLIGGILLRGILATPAIEMWDAAEKAYNNQAYADAKEKYEKFLEAYPKDDNAGRARVRILVIRVRQDAADPERGLATAKEVLPLVAKETDAETAREEFPSILPQIPQGFVTRAKQAKDTKSKEELLGKAKESLELITDPENIPPSKRTLIQPQLNRLGEDIQLVQRTINQEKDLALALADISTAEQAGETNKAFERYKELLKLYPGLRDHNDVKQAVLKIASREKALVKVVEEPIRAATEEVPRASERTVVLASRTGSGEAKPQNPVVTVLAGGSVYALDAGNGQMLWRRFVGHATRSHPVPLSSQPDADILLVDTHRRELVRLKPRTGALVWRFPVGESFNDPVVSGKRVLVAANSGKLLEIDPETGLSSRHVAIPQKLTVAPAAATDQPYLFQVGDHSNIYVLNADTLECVDVIYLGHKSGTIEVPSLFLLGHLFIAENMSSDRARVHVLKIRTDGDGEKLFPTQDPILTGGRLVVPLVVYNRRLLFVTDRAEIRVFDVDKTKNKDSVTDTGKLPGTLTSPMSCYSLADGQTLWIADNKLTKYTVQVTRKEIVRDPTITAVGDTFIAPLQTFGNTLIHSRRPANSTGTLVAAVNVDNPRQTLWQQHLGVPAGKISVNLDTNEIVAISSGASLFRIDSEVLKSGYSDTPVVTAAGTGSLSFTEPIEFEKNIVAFFNPAENRQLMTYDPSSPQARLRIVNLQLNDGKACCTPVAFQGGLLTPTDRGQVLLLRLADGSNQVLPFQPTLEPGEKLQWRRPAIVGDASNEFVIVDDRKNIYRIGVKEQPQPHLAELKSNRLDAEFASGLAAVGDTLFGVVRANAGDLIVGVSATELKVGKEWDLKGGRVTWGPTRVGDKVMVVVDEKELRSFTAGEKEVWPRPAVMHGQPAGMPLVDGDALVFASVTGAVWRINAATGKEIAKAELGEPLGAGPVEFRGRLLLCGNDGALHVIPMPTGNSGG